MLALALTLAVLSGAQAQSDTTCPAISLNATDGSTTFTGLPTPLVGTVFDAGGMGQLLAVRLSRNHTGTREFWDGNNWTGNDPYWMASVSPAGAPGDYNWSVNVPWPTGDKLPRGNYTLHVSAFDNANNRSDILRTVTIGAPDTTAPALAISSPAHGELIDNAQRGLTTITGTVNDGAGTGVAYIDVYLAHKWSQQFRWWNGASWSGWAKLATTLSAPDAQGNQVWSVSVPLPSAEQLATGQYYLDALAYDRSGNGAFDRHVFNVTPFDGTPPTANITFPSEGQQLTRLPAIRGTASDIGSGVFQVNVALMRCLLQSNGSEQWEYWNNTYWSTQAPNIWLPDVSEIGWTRDQNLPMGAELPPGRYLVMVQTLDRYNNVGMDFRNFAVVPVPPLSVDAHIRADLAGAWLGEGFSNADAQGQTLSGTIQSGQAQTRYVRIKMSGGDASKTVRVTIRDWAAFAAAGWTARFFDAPQGGSEITGPITSASGWTTTMSDGNERQIRVEMVAPTNIEAGATRALTFRVEADPTSETSALDVVKATWNTVAPTPDLSIRAGNNNGVWLGADVRNQDGAGQTLERVAAPGHVVRGEIQLSVTDAADGQIVRWSVPDWDALRADGWDAKFFDAPSGGNDITGQITGEGWTTRHTNGYQKVIGFEVTVPENASDITRILSVRAQVAGGVADVVKAKIRVLPNVRPDVAISRLKRGELERPYVGDNIYSPEPQHLDMVAAVGDTENFAVKITNPTATAAAFLFEAPELPAGWSYKLYNDIGGELDFENGSVITPLIAPYENVTWRLDVMTSKVSEPQIFLPVRFSGAGAVDECQVVMQLQGVKGAKYTLDGGATWKEVEGSVLSVPRGSTLGFEAIKLNPGVPWPNDPFEPIWSHDGKIYYGEKVFLYYPDPTPEGEDGQIARVACGNDFTVQVKVKSEETTP